MEVLLQRRWGVSPRLRRSNPSSTKMDLIFLAERERIHDQFSPEPSEQGSSRLGRLGEPNCCHPLPIPGMSRPAWDAAGSAPLRKGSPSTASTWSGAR